MRGFSIVELLIVLVIMIMILWVGFGAFQEQIRKQRLGEAVMKTVADLNYWRKKSMIEQFSYGLYIQNAGRIDVFKDADGDCTYDNGEMVSYIELPEGVFITVPSNSNLRTIVWTRRGIPLNGSCGFYANTLTFTAGSHEKEIIISRGGRIRIE